MNTITGFTFYDSLNKLTVGTLLLLLIGGMIGEKAETNILFFVTAFIIGIFYQTIIKNRTRFLTNNLHMIKKAHENVILKNKYIYKDDYQKAAHPTNPVEAVQMLTQNCCQTIYEEWYVFDSFHLCAEAFDL